MILDLNYDFWTEKFPFWLAFIILTFFLALVFIKRGLNVKSEIKSQKYIYFGYASFLYSYIITRIFFILSDLERMHNGKYYATYVLTGYIFTISALTLLIFTMEKYLVFKTKKAFSIISFIGLISTLIFLIISFFNENIIILGRIMAYIFSGITILFVFTLYLYLGLHTSGKLRRNIILSFVGLIIMAVGILSDMEYLAQAGIIPIQIPPIIAALGEVLFVLGQKPL
ncbi:MAG: hypothetical protein ACTSVC_02825 [Promethearchaeota archaeon]